jgi:holin-like protein
VVQELDLLAEHGVAIIIILAVSVVLTLLATVATFLAVSRLMASERENP